MALSPQIISHTGLTRPSAPTGQNKHQSGKNAGSEAGGTSAATKLPVGWTGTTLGAVTEDKVPQTGPDANGDFIYIDISSIDNEAKRIVAPKTMPTRDAPSRAKQKLKAGDVVVSMTRPNLNAVALIPNELEGAIGSTGFDVLRANGVIPAWLFYAVQMNDFIGAMSNLVQGALYPAVRPKDIRAFPLRLAPLAEQARIVAKIDELFSDLDAGVAALERVRATLKRYRASVLKAAVEGRLTEEWRRKNPPAETAD
jgi:type I restriction enzyme S subunit